MTRGKRTRLATGIYKDASGIALCTKVHGVQLERRYALDSDLNKLIAIRANWIVERESGEVAAPSTPFWDACTDYLRTIPAKTKRHANAYNDLHCWRAIFHGLNVKDITAAMIQTQLAAWRPDFQPSTLNKRRQELKNLFDFLGGANPVGGVPKFTERYDDARGVPPAVVEAVLAQMNETETKIRLRVIYETSLTPIDLTRIQQAYFKPRQRTIYIPERQKGAGAPALTMTLTRGGVEALKRFFAAKLNGRTFSSGTMWRDFHKAVQKAKAAWKGVWPAPANFHPYDLRHARLTEALRRSGNLQGVQQLARHKHVETTMRYLRALETDSLRAVTDAMDGTVPAGTVKTRQNGPKRTTGRSGANTRKS